MSEAKQQEDTASVTSVRVEGDVMPLEPDGGNVYRPHKLMITSGQFWRCAHGRTGLDGRGAWDGCIYCAKEDPAAFARFYRA